MEAEITEGLYIPSEPFQTHSKCMEEEAGALHPQSSFPPHSSPIEDRKG